MTDRVDRERPDDADAVDIGASSTVALGLNGQQGDYIKHLVVRNVTGAVLGSLEIKDGSDPAEEVYTGSVVAAGLNSEMRPWTIPVGIRSRVGGWSVIVGAGYEVTAVGRFTGGT